MSALSESVIALLQRLYAPGQRRGEERREWLRVLAEGGIQALPAVLPLVKDPQLAETASEVVGRLLSQLPPGQWPTLEPRLRGWPPIGGEPLLRWRQLEPRDLPALGRLPQGQWVIAAATAHPNGRVREMALRLLDKAMQDGRELPFLLVRLNDWVEAVRSQARAGLEARLTGERGEALLDCLPLVQRMASWQRSDHRPLLDRILAILQDPGLLERALLFPDRQVQRFAYPLAFKVLPQEEVLRRALAQQDQVLLRWVGQRLSQPEVSEELLLQCTHDGRLTVRRAALAARLARGTVGGQELLERLLDPAPGVRELARQHLPGLDLRAFYLSALDGRQPASALASLARVGHQEDAQLIAPWCAHPSSRVAREAVRALGRLDREGYLETLLACLADSRPSVAGAAGDALRPAPAWLASRFGELAENAQLPGHTRRQAAQLLERASKWGSVARLVRLLDDPALSCCAQALLRRWLQGYNRRQTRAEAGQLADLRQALKELSAPLPERMRAELASF